MQRVQLVLMLGIKKASLVQEKENVVTDSLFHLGLELGLELRISEYRPLKVRLKETVHTPLRNLQEIATETCV